ncbi:WxL domain-containing protein [Alicyclobacillus sp. SO9]|uniref:WxL domain-containing protein n=1 Tax=Alicyclobacillus sp. SO9 TaxID=2665646 RepID=UPI0018E83D60|nr:WxL domain-containing protein [Alicyclobacillus sp. SO9]QQE79524.1 WxL domain-containing protein [Alicyclobacillus sp. SO9]
MKMKSRRRIVKGVALSSLLSGALSTQIAYAGSLSVSAPNSITFPATTLTGAPQTLTTNVPGLQVGDTTGTGQGYHLTVQASPFTSTNGKHTLPAGSLTLQAPNAITEKAQVGPNLVANPGFEDPYADWQLYASSSTTTVQNSYSTTTVHSGKYAYQLSASKMPSGSYVHLHQWIGGIHPGTHVLSSLFVDVTQLSNSKILYEADFYDASGKFQGALTSDTVTSTTSGWTQLSLQGTVPAHAVSVAIYPKITATATNGQATVYLDDANFQESGSGVPAGTTNLVTNPGFETISGVGNLFVNNCASGEAWKNTTGSVSFGSNGVTLTQNNSTLVTRDQWLPYRNEPLTIQTTFVTPANTPVSAGLQLWQKASNNYQIVWQGDENFVLYKVVNGTGTPIAATGLNGAQVNQSANTTYTLTLTLSSSGALTGTLYSGAGSSGTKLITLTANDTHLHGPFSASVFGDTGPRFNQMIVKGGLPQSWGNYTQGTVGSSTIVPTTVSPFNGSHALQFSAYNVGANAAQFWMEGISVKPNMPFTATGEVWIKTLRGVHLTYQIDWFNSSGNYITTTGANYSSTTNGYMPIRLVGTTPANAASGHLALVLGDNKVGGYGTVEADDMSFQYGTTTPPVAATGAPWAIDTKTPVTLLSAPVWTGMSQYTVHWPADALKLTLEPKSTYTNPSSSSTTYQSQLTYSIVSGP